MPRAPIEQEALKEIGPALIAALQAQFTPNDAEFLLSFKQGRPDWALFDRPAAANLPAIKWNLINIEKLASSKEKHQEQLTKLRQVLSQWRVAVSH